MTQSSFPAILLIGAGNVGYHLGLRFYQQGYYIKQVFSRTKQHARRLAQLLEAEPTSQLKELYPDADIYIIAVKDDAIESVAKNMVGSIPSNALVVHTSGATPGKVLRKHFANFGVFYPLQSFSRDRAVNFSKIPICIDSSRKKNRQLLHHLAKGITNQVFQVNDKQRKALHVAAVFANNFVNQLYKISQQITESEKVPFDLLKPLIEETAAKVQEKTPQTVQTGPAIRGDINTIGQHLEWLKYDPDFLNLYRLLTHQINPALKNKV